MNDLYLLSILNSRLIETYYRSQTSTIRGDFLRFKKIYLDLLPIKNITNDEKKGFIKIVENILLLTEDEDYSKNLVKQSKVLEYEELIDRMVFDLYDLTKKERETIINS